MQIVFGVFGLVLCGLVCAEPASYPQIQAMDTWRAVLQKPAELADYNYRWVFLQNTEVRALAVPPPQSEDDYDGETEKLEKLRRQAAPYDVPLPIFPLEKRYRIAGLYPELQVQAVEHGWLVGVDNGEWGGALLWFDRQIKQRKTISRTPITRLLKIQGKLLALTNRGHMIENQVDFFEVEPARPSSGKWHLTKVDTWPQRAKGIQQQADQRIVFLFENSVAIMGASLKMETWCRFHYTTQQEMLPYTNSLIYSPQTQRVYFGTEGSVGVIDTKRCEVKYLLPPVAVP